MRRRKTGKISVMRESVLEVLLKVESIMRVYVLIDEKEKGTSSIVAPEETLKDIFWALHCYMMITLSSIYSSNEANPSINDIYSEVLALDSEYQRIHGVIEGLKEMNSTVQKYTDELRILRNKVWGHNMSIGDVNDAINSMPINPPFHEIAGLMLLFAKLCCEIYLRYTPNRENGI